MSERTGYLTEEEVTLAQLMPDSAPYAITGISQSLFSIARHYGGMTYQGQRYVYIPEHDECIRADVLRLVRATRKAAEKAKRHDERQRAKDAQGSLL